MALGSRSAMAVFLLFTVIVTLAYGWSLETPHPASGDSPQYLAGAYHLFHHGVFAQTLTADPVPPAVGREPGYAVALSLLMAVSPEFRAFSPDCLTGGAVCDDALYRRPLWLNVVLIGLSGLLLFAAARRLTGSITAGWVAAAYLLLNAQMHDARHHVISDHLAVFLLCLLFWTIAWAGRRSDIPGVGDPGVKGASDLWPWMGRWALVGATLLALILTKAVFLALFLAMLAVALVLAVVARGRRRAVFGAALAVALVAGSGIAAWSARNAAVGGAFGLTDSRAGVALSTREVFNHMTPTQYLAAFVYWTRGFGDGLARDLFDKEAVWPFELYAPGGFYDVGQHRFRPMVEAIQRDEGLSRIAAQRRVERHFRSKILDRPLTHLVTTLPLFYRGLWVDEFILIGLPLLIWAWFRTLRRRQFLEWLLLTSGGFNLVFYALISLNIPRYQMTAVPAIALAAALAVHAWRQGR